MGRRTKVDYPRLLALMEKRVEGGDSRNAASEAVAKAADEIHQDSIARHLRRLFNKKHGSRAPTGSGNRSLFPGLGALLPALRKRIEAIDHELGQPISPALKEAAIRQAQILFNELKLRRDALRALSADETKFQVRAYVTSLEEIDPDALVSREIAEIEELMSDLDIACLFAGTYL